MLYVKVLRTKEPSPSSQYYLWRDNLLKHGHQAFETKNITKKEQHLEQEVKNLKNIIGDLTVELKKNDYEL